MTQLLNEASKICPMCTFKQISVSGDSGKDYHLTFKSYKNSKFCWWVS